MKPRIDPKNPIVKLFDKYYQSKISAALELTLDLEKSVVPIYHTVKKPYRPEQIGSGVIVNIHDEFFIFSASHVFDDIGENQLLIGLGEGEKILSLAGERYSSLKGKSGTHLDDPIDASVFHIKDCVTKKIEQRALTIDQLDIEEPDELSICIACGFRVKNSNTKNYEIKSKQEVFPSIEINKDQYSKVGADTLYHTVMSFEAYYLREGHVLKSPKPRGISGGAMFKAYGINHLPNHNRSIKPYAKLNAITISHKQEKGNQIGAIVATKVILHLNLIELAMPGFTGLFDI